MLVVVAHPDDESFGCGSILAHAAAGGVDTIVCCATRGEAGSPDPDVGRTGLGAVRERELRAAADLLDVGRVVVFDYEDSGIAGDVNDRALVAAPLDRVAATIAAWVARLRLADPDSEYLELGRLGTPDEDITTVLDADEHYELRWRAIRAHASQTSPFEIMPPDLQWAFLATDRLRRIRPPWPGGELERKMLPVGSSRTDISR
jgi:N-acetyl-1-D-myo-inositol-2-amino-2-deoxy-alpha-D-glucopyranoside deacetylase